MDSSMRIEAPKQPKQDLNFSAFESHLSPSVGQSSRLEPKKELGFSAFDSQLAPREKSVKSVKKEEHSLNDFASFHSNMQQPQQQSLQHIIDRQLHQAEFPHHIDLPLPKNLPSLQLADIKPAPDVLNVSDIPMASSKSLDYKSVPLAPIISDAVLPSQTHSSGSHIDLQHRLNSITSALVSKFQEAHDAVKTVRQQDRKMYNEFKSLKDMVEGYIRTQRQEVGKSSVASNPSIKQPPNNSLLSTMLDRLESLAHLINSTVEERKKQQLNQFYSPLAYSNKVQMEDPEESYVPEKPEIQPRMHQPANLNRFAKYPLFFLNEQYGSSSAYRALFEQNPHQQKSIYSSSYLQVTSKYSVLDNYERGKLVRLVLKFTNIGESFLKEFNVQLKSKQTLISKPKELSLVHFPPGQTIIQEVYLPRFNDSDYFIELTASVKTETMGKRKIMVPVARDICKFIDCVQVKNLESGFSSIAGGQNLQLRARLSRFNEKLLPLKKVNGTTFVMAYRFLNRAALNYLKVEKVDRQNYQVLLLTDQSEEKLAAKFIEYLNFLYE